MITLAEILQVACQCGIDRCIFDIDAAFTCERCTRVLPACVGGFMDDGEIDPWCDECRYGEPR